MKKNLVVVPNLPQSLLLNEKEVERYHGYYESITKFPPVMRLITAIGGNTGNFFFHEAVVKQLGYENCDFVRAHDILTKDTDFLRERFAGYDKVFLQMANLIRVNNLPYAPILFDKIMEASDARLILTGLGAQLAEGEKPSEEILQSLARVAERCHSIGVRGEQTADILHLAGIKNVEAVGCPTMFFSLNPFFQMEKKPLDPDNYKYLYYGELGRKGMEFMLQNKGGRGVFVMQSEVKHFYDYDKQSYPDWGQMVISATLGERYRLSEQQVADLDEIMRNQSLVFSSMHDWMATVKDYDFSYGPRFHGNMAALQSGVPALFVRHDSRTKELIDYFFLPSCSYSDLEVQSREALYEQLDYSSFNKAYPLLYSRYRNFLNKNGVSHVLPPGSEDHLVVSDLRRAVYSSGLGGAEKEMTEYRRLSEGYRRERDEYRLSSERHKKKRNRYKKLSVLSGISIVLLCSWLAYFLIK